MFRRRALSVDARCDASRFATVEGLWDGALTRGLRAPGFRLVRDGTTLADASIIRSAGIGNRTLTDLIQPNRVLELYHGGATMVLQGLQHSDLHLGRMANNVALALDHPVQVNAYLTPPETRGLELHFDYHDVFVLQLDGAKRWRVWDPLEWTREPVRGGPAIRRPKFDELGEPAIDRELRPGDCLYLPRGTPHAAEALAESSAHLTIGLMAITWQLALARAVAALAGDRSTSASIPVGALGGAGPTVPPDRILAGLEEGLAPARLRRWMVTEVWRRQPATRLRPLHPPAIDAAAPLTWMPGPLLWLLADGPRARMGLGDRELDLPGETHQFLADLLAEDGPVTAATGCSALDHESRSTVVWRLVVEGALARA